MTRGSRALRTVAILAVWGGYVMARARNGLLLLATRLFPERGWRTVEAADVIVRVPPEWGEVAAAPAGGLVIHNRPRRFRVDGDAVWYSSAIELRIRPPSAPPSRSAEAMTIESRSIGAGDRQVWLDLVIANGVGPRQRRVARRVLDSARPIRRQHMGSN